MNDASKTADREYCEDAFTYRKTTKAERDKGSYTCSCGRKFRLGAAQREAVDSMSTGVRTPSHKVSK